MNETTSPRSPLRHILGILSGPVVFVVFLLLPPPEGLTPQGMKCVAAAMWIILWWMTDAFPIALTSLFSLVLYSLLGVMKPLAAFGFMGNPSIILLLGAMLLLGVWKESKLVERYAYWAISLSCVRGRPLRLLLVFSLAAGLLSMLVPNIPVAILFVSIAVAMAKGVKAERGTPLYRCLCLSSGVSSALGGAGTPIGGAPNLVVIGVIASALHYDIQFWEWSAIGFPMAVIWLLGMVAVYWFIFLRGDSTREIPVDIARERLKELGPVNRHEHIAMATMLFALLLWSVGQPIAKSLGLPFAKMLTAPLIALLCGCLVFFIPLKTEPNGRVRFSLTWQEGLRAVNWDILIFVVGALAFGQMLINGGVDKWVAGLIASLLGEMSPTLVWIVIMTIAGVVSQAFSNVAVIGLLLPVTASLAQQYGLNPVVTCLTVGMVANIGIMFPFSSPPAAAAIMGSDGYVDAGDFFKSALPVLIFAAATALLVGSLLGDLVFPMNSLPGAR